MNTPSNTEFPFSVPTAGSDLPPNTNTEETETSNFNVNLELSTLITPTSTRTENNPDITFSQTKTTDGTILSRSTLNTEVQHLTPSTKTRINIRRRNLASEIRPSELDSDDSVESVGSEPEIPKNTTDEFKISPALGLQIYSLEHFLGSYRTPEEIRDVLQRFNPPAGLTIGHLRPITPLLAEAIKQFHLNQIEQKSNLDQNPTSQGFEELLNPADPSTPKIPEDLSSYYANTLSPSLTLPRINNTRTVNTTQSNLSINTT